MNLPLPKCVQCGQTHCQMSGIEHGPGSGGADAKEPVNVKDAMKGVLGVVQITKGKKGKPAKVKHFKITKIAPGTGPGPALKPGTGPGSSPLDYKPMMGREGGAD